MLLLLKAAAPLVRAGECYPDCGSNPPPGSSGCGNWTIQDCICRWVEDNCSDGNDCTDDACVSGVCTNPPRDCDDGNPCTDDSCENGSCVYRDKDCDDGDRCTTDSCDSTTGQCVNTPVDDLCECNPCSEGCPPPPPPCDCQDACGPKCPVCACEDACDDGDPCTDDVCDSASGTCSNPPKNCSDSKWCTDDTCEDGRCVHRSKDCDDGDGCTDDSCDEANDQCVHPPKNCNDNNACTQDTCVGGQCLNTPIVCGDDGDLCTEDFCDPAQGCVHPPKDCSNESTCDQDLCDGDDGECYHVSSGCDCTEPGQWQTVPATIPKCDPATEFSELLWSKSDQCGHTLEVWCYAPIFANAHYVFKDNGVWVGKCIYKCGFNSFRYQMTSDGRRFLKTRHVTMDNPENLLYPS